MPLSAFGINCTLKPSPKSSSTQRILDEVLQALRKRDVAGTSERAVDCDVKPGVTNDEGDGDAWPELRRKILDADIFVVATPIWLGQPSSVAKRVLERLDALLGESDEHQRFPSYGRVAVVAVVGNEDGAHHVSAELYQALVDVGFTVPAAATGYWVGEAMGATDFQDLPGTPDKVASAIRQLASNAAHLAKLLKASPYPGT